MCDGAPGSSVECGRCGHLQPSAEEERTNEKVGILLMTV